MRIYGYWTLVSMTASLTQHLSAVAVFVSLFVNTYYEFMSPSQLIVLAELTIFSGYVVWMAYVRYKGASFRYEGIPAGGCPLSLCREADSKVGDHLYHEPAGHLADPQDAHRGH